jgi:AraC-like DNA-binding protein
LRQANSSLTAHWPRPTHHGGTSFTAYVTELRLQQALKLLTESERGVLRIADVALEAGFSDVSYFNRLFRSRFGDPPRDVRAQVLHKIRTYK